MSAKHKRPFYVFAAVALVCGSILFVEVRGTADNDGGPAGDRGQATPASVHAGDLIDPSPAGAGEGAGPDDEEGGFGAGEGAITTSTDGPIWPTGEPSTPGGDPTSGSEPRYTGLQLGNGPLIDPNDLPGVDDVPEDDGTTKTRGEKDKNDKNDKNDDDPNLPEDYNQDIPLDGDPSTPPDGDEDAGDDEAGGFGDEGTDPQAPTGDPTATP